MVAASVGLLLRAFVFGCRRLTSPAAVLSFQATALPFSFKLSWLLVWISTVVCVCLGLCGAVLSSRGWKSALRFLIMYPVAVLITTLFDGLLLFSIAVLRVHTLRMCDDSNADDERCLSELQMEMTARLCRILIIKVLLDLVGGGISCLLWKHLTDAHERAGNRAAELLRQV